MQRFYLYCAMLLCISLLRVIDTEWHNNIESKLSGKIAIFPSLLSSVSRMTYISSSY